MSVVHLLMKHPPYPYNAQAHLAAGEVMGVFAARAEAQKIANDKNARNPSYLWSVTTRRIKEAA